LQAFGVYMVRISEPAKFVREFAGIANEVYIQDVEERLRGMVMGKFAEATAEAGVSVLDLATNYSEIGAKIKPILQAVFEPFGMEIVDFQISSTTLPPEVTAFYDKMTNMNMVDNMQRFQQFQAANAIEESAKNGGSDGGNIASSLATAQLMMNQMNQQQINPTAQPVNKEDIMNTLKQLADLKTAGVITEEEFNAKKKELLEKL
jgi:membrane protease subunit (stomatin/prohibitin family)